MTGGQAGELDSYARIGGQTNLTESGVQYEAMNSEFSSMATPDLLNVMQARRTLSYQPGQERHPSVPRRESLTASTFLPTLSKYEKPHQSSSIYSCIPR
jgi:hypothetical protein